MCLKIAELPAKPEVAMFTGLVGVVKALSKMTRCVSEVDL